MKLLFEFFPIIIFFAVYKYTGDIITATAVLIPATAIQIGFTWFRERKIEKMHLVTLVLVVIFGGATVILEDKTFIQWKPSVINWLFALAFLATQFIGKKPLVQRMMEANIELPREIWSRLNWAWIIFFAVSGVLNLIVVYTMSEEAWVNFKLFGMLGLTLVFIILQGLYLTRHIKEPEESNDSPSS